MWREAELIELEQFLRSEQAGCFDHRGCCDPEGDRMLTRALDLIAEYRSEVALRQLREEGQDPKEDLSVDEICAILSAT